MNDKDQELLEEAYRLVREETNPDAKEDEQLKETFKKILKAYRIEQDLTGIVTELFDAVQKHIKETMSET
jgi:hypothetical protein